MHRPTWHAAKGASSNTGVSQGGYLTDGRSHQYHAQALPGQLTLKTRQPGQGTAEEIAGRDLLAELEAAERVHYDAVRKAKGTLPAVYLAAAEAPAALMDAPAPAAPAAGSGSGGGSSQAASHDAPPAGLTAEQAAVLAAFDDADADLGSEDSGSDSEDEEEEEDDMAELMAELEKIKAERAAEAARRAAEEDELARKDATAAALSGNPLLALGGGGGASATVRRRWDEDVVFRAQTATEPVKKKRFVNDTIRNDFHRSFLSKYIK